MFIAIRALFKRFVEFSRLLCKDFLTFIPVHIIVSWYDTARATSDAITLPIQGKLPKVQKSSKSNLYDSNINWY